MPQPKGGPPMTPRPSASSHKPSCPAITPTAAPSQSTLGCLKQECQHLANADSNVHQAVGAPAGVAAAAAAQGLVQVCP
jgi:hypothetical protein